MELKTYDAFSKRYFNMRAALLWTVNDFPAYAMLSGWSTQGRLACPCCHYDTCSQYLKYSKKTCYLGHRRFLGKGHPWRFDERSFNGKIEERNAPTPLTGSEVLQKLGDYTNNFGKKKKKKRKKNNCPWKKKSIFFQLPYWEKNALRHNLDVMHIEKNIFDNIIGTLLDIQGKTKDHIHARLDLQHLGFKEELHPTLSEDGQYFLYSKACFSMSSEEKEVFCKVIKDAKLPNGCASNISHCVHVNDKKISGYKTHDAHIILHYLLQVVVKKALPKQVAIPIIKLGVFFKTICSKVIRIEDLPGLQSEIVEILCQFEKIFPPSFFDVMMHLPVHLINEIRLGGPVHYRWMYWMERYLCRLKSYVRNKYHVEASIAEGYIVEECLIHCSRYMHDGVKTRLSRGQEGYSDGSSNNSCNIFSNHGYPIGGKSKEKEKSFTLSPKTLQIAHRYALFNANNEEVDNFIKEHQDLISRQNKRSRWAKENDHTHGFAFWFKTKVQSKLVSDHIFWLANGPSSVCKRYYGYFVNGYKFSTRARDGKYKTQNSGVTVTASTPSFASSKDQNPVLGDVTYYGALRDIIELSYHNQGNVVLFKCDWFEEEKDDFGLIRVNFKKLCYVNDPFVFPSQVHQVFYVKDPIEDGRHYVMKRVPRDLFEMDEEDANEGYWNEYDDIGFSVDHIVNDEGSFSSIRTDLPKSTVGVNIDVLVAKSVGKEDVVNNNISSDRTNERETRS
ncbi:unnamed protein product [Cuscuta europaea]|uniref:DUF4218 domain-containing protein n=1 Tax=Cuscuta europaea TaxID=41803 RepID=A0A9P1EIF0_CUSEU|nr:unnamed protein product [Cuscuta europaea]